MANVDTPDDQTVAVNYGDMETDDWASKHQITLSELASRLNAKQHFDNRGRQIWTDGFEELVLQWIPTVLGASTTTRDTTTAWRGAACNRHTHAAMIASQVTMTKHFYTPQTGRYGYEISFAVDALTFNDIRFSMRYYDGVIYYTNYIRIMGTTGEVFYQNVGGVWVSTGFFVTLSNDIRMWHKVKFVMDIDLQEYVRVMIDGNELNLVGVPCWQAGSITTPRIICDYRSQAANNIIQNFYFDDFILTHLEP